MPENPYLKFFPADWLSNLKLRKCSPAARGVWIDCICLMSQCEPFGHLVEEDGSPMTAAEFGRVTATDPTIAESAFRELLARGVAKLDPAGRLYSSRMVRDFARSQTNSRAGKLGAQASWASTPGHRATAAAEPPGEAERRSGRHGDKIEKPAEISQTAGPPPRRDATAYSYSYSYESASSDSGKHRELAEKLPSVTENPEADKAAGQILLLFLCLRDELWPNESRLPSPALTIKRDAAKLMEEGAPAALIAEILERGMRRRSQDGADAVNGLRFFEERIREATRAHNKPRPASSAPSRPAREGKPAGYENWSVAEKEAFNDREARKRRGEPMQ